VESFILQGDKSDSEGESKVLIRREAQRPKMYKVLLHNDDYTTMEFVVKVLQKIFHKTVEEANAIMMSVHMSGMGVCGIYTYEIAESKVQSVKKFAKESNHPLKCTIESE
jgi:ATP-dependent Clp protease adaptor protein ClpS